METDPLIGRVIAGKMELLALRFQAEARAASRLDHPNSVRILDFGEDGPTASSTSPWSTSTARTFTAFYSPP